jgi:hypothetical protein
MFVLVFISGRVHPVRASASVTERRSQSSTSLHSESRSNDHTSSQSGANTGVLKSSSGDQQHHRTERAESIFVEQGTESSTGIQTSKLEVNTTDTVDDVEVAEEATSEMAFQSLHQAPSEIANRHDSSSHEGSPAPQEIPLEDMSRKMKSKRKEQLTRAKLTKSRLAAELRMQQEQSRSNSQSPKRKPSSESVTKVKLRGRSTSLTDTHDSSGRSRSGTPERRFHSESSPLPYSSNSHHSYRLKKKSKECQTQTSMHAEARSSRKDIKESLLKSDTPKTLTPAPSPPVSLVPKTDFETPIKDSPKLMPPVDEDRARSFSDISQVSSENDMSSLSSSNRSSDSLNPPNLGLDVPVGAGAEMTTATVKVETLKPPQVTGGKTASDKLTQLAQMVQHYNFDGEEEATTDIDK